VRLYWRHARETYMPIPLDLLTFRTPRFIVAAFRTAN
jgi:hypothetical protein